MSEPTREHLKKEDISVSVYNELAGKLAEIITSHALSSDPIEDVAGQIKKGTELFVRRQQEDDEEESLEERIRRIRENTP